MKKEYDELDAAIVAQKTRLAFVPGAGLVVLRLMCLLATMIKKIENIEGGTTHG